MKGTNTYLNSWATLMVVALIVSFSCMASTKPMIRDGVYDAKYSTNSFYVKNDTIRIIDIYPYYSMEVGCFVAEHQSGDFFRFKSVAAEDLSKPENWVFPGRVSTIADSVKVRIHILGFEASDFYFGPKVEFMVLVACAVPHDYRLVYLPRQYTSKRVAEIKVPANIDWLYYQIIPIPPQTSNFSKETTLSPICFRCGRIEPNGNRDLDVYLVSFTPKKYSAIIADGFYFRVQGDTIHAFGNEYFRWRDLPSDEITED